MTDLLLRDVRRVGAAPDGGRPSAARTDDDLVDVRVRGGCVVAVEPAGSSPHAAADEVLDGEGRWVVPGLWDAHVHLDLAALEAGRVPLGGTHGPEDVVARIAEEAARLDAVGQPDAIIQGSGFRLAGWDVAPSVPALDAVSGAHPVILTSGDAHSAWLNSAALRLLGRPERPGHLAEDEWFSLMRPVQELPDTVRREQDGLAALLDDALARGVAGLRDMSVTTDRGTWARRIAAGVRPLRTEVAVYPEALGRRIDAGLRHGSTIPGTEHLGTASSLVTQGPLKVIVDGSLGTGTAFCRDPYPAGGHGVLNVPAEDLEPLVRTATGAGLTVALHAIGDATVGLVLDVVEATGARGAVEHLQMATDEDLVRAGSLGLVASVQPAHLLDDGEAARRLWPGRERLCYRFAAMAEAGVRLALGSDAPVSPLDPWLAMAVAVHRADPRTDEAQWSPEQAISPAAALAASTRAGATVSQGQVADLVLLDRDPLGGAAAEGSGAAAVSVAASGSGLGGAPGRGGLPAAERTRAAALHLLGVQVDATIVDGQVRHLR